MPEIQASSGYPGRAAPGSPEGEEEPEVGSEPGEGESSEEIAWATTQLVEEVILIR